MNQLSLNKNWLLGLCLLGTVIGCDQTTRQQDKQVMVEKYHAVRSSLMYDMALSQFETGDLDQAAQSVAKGLNLNAEHPGLYVLAGRIELERANLDRSYNAFDQARLLLEMRLNDPESAQLAKDRHDWAEALYFKALVLQRWMRFDDALEGYEQAFEIEPQNASYLLASAEMMVSLDRPGDAIELIESHYQKFAQNASVSATLAHLYRISNDHRKALALFREASILDPENLKVREEYAIELVELKEWDAAASVLKEILTDSKYKKRLDLQRLYAAVYIELGLLEEARSVYSQVVKDDAAGLQDWVKSGELAIRVDDLGAALSVANRVMSLAPNQAEGYLLAGVVWQKRGDLTKALAMFDEAVRYQKDSVDAILLRGIALMNSGHHYAAKQAFKTATQRDPSDPRAEQLYDAISAVDR